jgi:hypothetical protein
VGKDIVADRGDIRTVSQCFSCQPDLADEARATSFRGAIGHDQCFAQAFLAYAELATSNFAWMLTANGSGGYNPTITDLQFTGRADRNFTVSNVWVGSAAALSLSAIPEPGTGVLCRMAAAALRLRRWPRRVPLALPVCRVNHLSVRHR